MGLPTYNVGTASVANGNQSVTFAGGAALTSVDPTTGAALAVCGAGDVLVVPGSGGSFGVIQAVVDTTHVTLETPWAGSTNATATYKIYRQSVPLTGSAAALAQTVLNQGSDSQPDLSRTIDSGVARTKLRIGSDGKAKLAAGTTGAADAALLDGLSIEPATGAVSFPNGVKAPGSRNRVIDGNFNSWQSGTSFAAITAAIYTADLFLVIGNGAAAAANKIAAPAGFRGTNALNITTTATPAGGYVGWKHRFEASNVQDIDGSPATYSFDLNATTSGGTLTGQVQLLANSAVDNGSFGTLIGAQNFTVPVGTGKVMATFTAAQTVGIKNGAELFIVVFQNTASGNINASLGALRFEKGSVANDFELVDPALERTSVERFVEACGIGGHTDIYSGGVNAEIGLKFKTQKRTTPSLVKLSEITVNNPAAGVSKTSVSGALSAGNLTASGGTAFMVGFSGMTTGYAVVDMANEPILATARL